MSDNKPKPIPRKTPGGQADSGKKKGGLTMREQSAARKKAEQEGQGAKPASKPAAKAARPAAKAAPKKVSKPVAKPVAKKAAAAPVMKSSAAKGDGDEKPKSERAARPSSRAGARKGGSARGARAKDEGDDDNGGTTRGRRARPEPKKKSPVPMIAAAVIVLGGAGAYFGGVFDGDTTEAAETGDNTTAAADPETAPEGGATDVGDNADAPAASGDAADAADAGAAVTDEGEADAGAGEAAAADAPDKPAAKAKAAEDDGEAAQSKSKTDMSHLKPFGKPPGATDEQWATLEEKAAEFFDPFSGAAGGRAQKKLIEAGKIAWPAILDVDDPEQNRMGFRAADALDRARGSDTGRALDWRTSQDSSTGEMKVKDLHFNKRLIILHHEAWAEVLVNPEHWAKFDKTDTAKEAAERAAEKAKGADDEFDDLDLGDIDID